MKVPLPVQPNPPARVHVPEIVFPFAVPLSVSVLPEGVPDFTIIPNVPFTLPLKFPVKPNDPEAVWPEVKHGDADVMVRFVTVSDPSPFTASDVPSVNAVVLLVSVNVALQLPLIFDGVLEEFEPHPTTASVANNRVANAKYFMFKPQSEIPKGRVTKHCGHCARGWRRPHKIA